MIHSKFALFSTRCPRCRSIDFRSVGTRNAIETAFQWLFQPYWCSLFAVTAFSCSDGKFPLGARRKAQWTGGTPLGSNNPCSTFRSPVPETNGQNRRNVCTSTESALIGSDAERKGYDDAMWEGDYDEPIVYVYRSSGKSGPIHRLRCRSPQ